MFGRVRASPSPSPLDSLEAPPSKIIKDDSLSIYEATLMKLKLGSQRHLISPSTIAEETDCASDTVLETTSDLSSEAINNIETTSGSGTVSSSCQDMPSDEEAMVIDVDSSSASVSDSSSDCQSRGNLNSQQRSEGMSILYMFSKFKAYQRTPISSEPMKIENDGSASFSEFQALSCAKDQGSHESSTSSSFPQLC